MESRSFFCFTWLNFSQFPQNFCGIFRLGFLAPGLRVLWWWCFILPVALGALTEEPDVDDWKCDFLCSVHLFWNWAPTCKFRFPDFLCLQIRQTISRVFKLWRTHLLPKQTNHGNVAWNTSGIFCILEGRGYEVEIHPKDQLGWCFMWQVFRTQTRASITSILWFRGFEHGRNIGL